MYISKPSKKWKESFVSETTYLEVNSPIPIEFIHIGSTSIDGLYAKDVVDILGLIGDFEAGFKLVQKHTELGYEYRGEYGIEKRHYFVKSSPAKVHLHIHSCGDINAEKHISFVKFMSSNPIYIEALNRLKIQLQEKYPTNKAEYQREKKWFYDNIHSGLQGL